EAREDVILWSRGRGSAIEDREGSAVEARSASEGIGLPRWRVGLRRNRSARVGGDAEADRLIAEVAREAGAIARPAEPRELVPAAAAARPARVALVGAPLEDAAVHVVDAQDVRLVRSDLAGAVERDAGLAVAVRLP